ncbi:MAG: Rab family GTPase [Candidatus Helarchaeota archaeon]
MSNLTMAFKCVLLGNQGTGKTSLILRFIKNKFNADYTTTLGVDFLTKDLKIKDTNIKLVIWDIGGQDIWERKLPVFLKGSSGAIIVSDLTRPPTVEAISRWREHVHKTAGPETPYVVVGNKNDLDRRVTKDDLKKQAEGQPFYETSAKTGDHVEEMFLAITELMIKHAAKKKIQQK